MFRRNLLCAAAAALMTGCSSMSTAEFAQHTPKLNVEDYFEGSTRAWGIFEDRFGRIRRQFTVDMTGRRDGEELVLEERFTYDDGDTDSRVWRIRKTGDGAYEGRAGDVIGVAAGEAAGNALHWRYTLNLRVGNGTWAVAFDDWMFLQPGGVLLNRAHMSKWGVEIGSLSLFFQKDGAGAAQAPVARRTAAK
jgi:Protein of unknown function (DUF3833)